VKILISSPAFLPNLGGLEIATDQLATLWAEAGHTVTVVTRTAGVESATPYRLLRNPSVRQLLREVRAHDLYYQRNISLREWWPLLLAHRPWAVSHHSWYTRTDGHVAWQDRLKRRMVRRADLSIAVSRAIAEDVGGRTIVIGNPYRDALFRRLPDVERRSQLVFVGRLVSDKGVDLLLDALELLQARGLAFSLSIVGEGPEREPLFRQSRRLGLGDQVRFLGAQRNEELARTLNAHSILVVPSRYREPFGIVALEGIACGCAVVGSEGGGLPDAIGPCGRTFPNRDVGALAATLQELIESPDLVRQCLAAAPAHLAQHRGRAVADRYIEEFRRILR
jgi:glycosyltransferase involved in cell wall biosynthesis